MLESMITQPGADPRRGIRRSDRDLRGGGRHHAVGGIRRRPISGGGGRHHEPHCRGSRKRSGSIAPSSMPSAPSPRRPAPTRSPRRQRQIAETLELAAIICWTSLGFDRVARCARAAHIADRGDLAAALDRRGGSRWSGACTASWQRTPTISMTWWNARAASPARTVSPSRPARDHRRRRAARHAGRDQHAAGCVRGRGGCERVGRARPCEHTHARAGRTRAPAYDRCLRCPGRRPCR